MCPVTVPNISEHRSKLPALNAAKATLPAKPDSKPRRNLKPLGLLYPYLLRYKKMAFLALIALGYKDTMARRDEILRFIVDAEQKRA